MKDCTAAFTKKFPFNPTQDQLELFRRLTSFLQTHEERCSCFILSGYAGTGKTSCLQALTAVAKKQRWSVKLLAPTGRAAKIISNKTGLPAYTLHRQLYKASQNPYSGHVTFERCKNYKTNCLFIVDEASMVSAGDDEGQGDLLSDLIAYVFEQAGNKLVLVGDPAQLPPVGNIISPALQQEVLQYIYQLPAQEFELRQVLRQAKGSGILNHATRLRDSLNKQERSLPMPPSGEQSMVHHLPADKLKKGIAYAYEKYGLYESILLCATNKEAAYYNQFIRQEVLHRKNRLEPGDLLLVAKNNYYVKPKTNKTCFLANGEFVEVLEVLEEETLEEFCFVNLRLKLPDYPKLPSFHAKVIPETLVTTDSGIPPVRMKRLFELVLEKYAHHKGRSKQFHAARKDPYLNALQVKYAYALTCHKAQGGQWKAVFLKQGFWETAPDSPEKFRWLYTACTRASDELFFLR